jgi:hypothetical protein
VRFCPRYPRHVIQFSAVPDILANAQRDFFALELGGDSATPFAPVRFDLADSEQDGTLLWVGSTYSPENDVVYDGVSRPGVRVVTFAPILKHALFPLAPLIDALLKMATAGTSAPVELEFAAQLSATATPEFGILQLRPLGRMRDLPGTVLPPIERSQLMCSSDSVLGHGSIDNVRDLVVIDIQRFDRFKTREIARAVAQLNAELAAQRRPYVLIGVGRWGSADPLLGIPVTWDQIAGARAIVEAGFADFRVTPSQGSHFFQNLTAGDIGYFTVNPDVGDGFVDWDWLAGQPAVGENEYVRHLRFDAAIGISINGRAHTGVMVKPSGVRD